MINQIRLLSSAINGEDFYHQILGTDSSLYIITNLSSEVAARFLSGKQSSDEELPPHAFKPRDLSVSVDGPKRKNGLGRQSSNHVVRDLRLQGNLSYFRFKLYEPEFLRTLKGVYFRNAEAKQGLASLDLLCQEHSAEILVSYGSRWHNTTPYYVNTILMDRILDAFSKEKN